MPRSISRCPSCGVAVSPFAAGCAVCGEDLEAARAGRRTRPRILPAMSLPRLRPQARRPSSDWIQAAIAVLLAVFVTPIGLLLALFWAYQRSRDGDTLMMAVMLAAAGLGVISFLIPGWLWSQIY